MNTFLNVFSVLGGLAMFLYGMALMSEGLQKSAGDRLRAFMAKMTSNAFKRVLTGTVVTCLVQSSSATTIMVVSFVNAGLLTLGNAIGVIMGANIGTTITGQLIALNVGEIAPLIAFIGVACIVFSKNQKIRYIGNIFAGVGILFIGMNMMSSAMAPMREWPAFINLLSRFENPLLGIGVGAGFTAIIQSSAASIGILQALANEGVITLAGAAFVLFGQNIGTCITALLASIGTNRGAKRATMIHIMFNVFGTVLFTVLCLVTPFVSLVAGSNPGNPAGQIANMHTIFNIATTVVLIPFGTILAYIAEKVLPDVGEERTGLQLQYIRNIKNMNEEKLGVSAMSQNNTKLEIQRMLEMTRENVLLSFDVFRERAVEKVAEVDEREEYIDFLNKEISKFISRIITHERTEKGSQIFNSYFKITSNIERIGDHAVNMAGYALMLKEKDIQISDLCKQEVVQMKEICEEVFAQLTSEDDSLLNGHEHIVMLEQKIDDMTEEFRNGMMKRIQQGICSDEGSILFSEMLTDFERIGDHALNISKQLTKIKILEAK